MPLNHKSPEFPLITKGGARIEVLLNATTRRDEQGNVIGVVGIGQDITGRIAQEREYSKLIDTANAPIFGVDTQGCVNVWNQCARKLVGYSTDEVMGHSLVQEFITQDYQASVQAVLDQALAGSETANFEFPLITKAGARIEVLLNATTRRNEHGKVIGVVGEFCFDGVYACRYIHHLSNDCTSLIPLLFNRHWTGKDSC